MCTIEGPFYGGKVKEYVETGPVLLTDDLLKNMKGLPMLLEGFDAQIGEITETWFNEETKWWHLKALLTIAEPKIKGLAIDCVANKFPNGRVYGIRIRQVWIVDDPLDPLAAFVTI